MAFDNDWIGKLNIEACKTIPDTVAGPLDEKMYLRHCTRRWLISVRFRAVWSESAVRLGDGQGFEASYGGQQRRWSDCSDAQVYLSICWKYMS